MRFGNKHALLKKKKIVCIIIVIQTIQKIKNNEWFSCQGGSWPPGGEEGFASFGSDLETEDLLQLSGLSSLKGGDWVPARK